MEQPRNKAEMHHPLDYTQQCRHVFYMCKCGVFTDPTAGGLKRIKTRKAAVVAILP